MEVDFQKAPENVDEATAKIMQDLDESGDQQIDLDEFINGFRNWLNSSNGEIIPISPGSKTDASEVSQVTPNLLFIVISFMKLYI